MKPNPQVLLVDRHSSDVKVVRDVLGSAGLEVHVRTSASAALVAFHALEPDLVLVDFDVPGTSGAAVTREIKNTDRGRSTPVILMAEGPIEESQRAKTLDASGCSMLLQKPLLPQDLLDTLSRYLPGAFIGGKAPDAPAAKKSAPRRAAGVMRDPGTPFTADSFDDESLGALLDQVFPTADSGHLARAIRNRPSQSDAAQEASPSALASDAPAGARTAGVTADPEATVAPSSSASKLPPPSPESPRARPTPRQRSGGMGAAAPPSATTSDVSAVDGPALSTSASDTDASRLVADYLATDAAPDEDDLPTGLSIKDDQKLDAVFDGAWSRPTIADESEIEPLETAPSVPPVREPAAPAGTSGAGARASSVPLSEVEAPAVVMPSGEAQAPTSEAQSSFLDGLDLDDDTPKTGEDVWKQIEAALPSAPAEAPPAQSAGSRTSPVDTAARSTTAPVPPASIPLAHEEDSRRDQARASAAVPASVPEPAALQADDTARTPMSSPPVPSPEPTIPLARQATASPADESTIPLAREATGAAADETETTRPESRRSKKGKKGRDKRREEPKDSIPLAVMEQIADPSLPMRAQSVADSLSKSREEAASPSRPLGAEFRTELERDAFEVSAGARRPSLGLVVGAGLALAAAVALFFVWNRSSDSDLRPGTQGRSRTPAPEAPIANEPETSATPEEGPAREALPPVIPSTDTGAPGTSTPGSPPTTTTAATGAGSAGKAAVPAPASPAPGKTTKTPVAGPAAAGRAAVEPSGPTTRPATPPPPSAPAPPEAPAPGTAGGAEPSASGPAPTPTPAPEVAPPPSPEPVPEHGPVAAAGSEPAGAGARDPGEGATAAPASPPATGTSQPPPSEANAPVGQVAVGVTLPAPAQNTGVAPEPVSEPVAPLASPVPLSRTAPIYPPPALAMKMTGTVGLLVKVEADGRVSDVKVIRSASPSLNAAAVAAARRWTYRPAHRGSERVATWIEETVVFRLKS